MTGGLSCIVLALLGGTMACRSDIETPGGGIVLWHSPGVAGSGRPAIADTLVFFVAAPDSHVVHGFDLASGAVRWTTPTGLTGTGAYSETGCIIVQGAVACADGTDIIGLARLDGHLVWRYQATTNPQPWIFPITVDSLGTTVFAPFGGAIYAIDALTGSSKWVAQAASNPAVLEKVVSAGGSVFASYTLLARPDTGGVVAINAVDGGVRWFRPFVPSAPDSGSGARDLVVWGGLAIASLDDGRIVALEQSTGQVSWTLPGVGIYPGWTPTQGQPVGSDIRTLTVVGSTLVTASESGWIIGYDLPSHTELWRTAAKDAASLMFADSDGGAMYFTSTSELLFAFSAAHGALLWQVGPPSIFIAAPAIGTDRVFVGATNGYYAIRK